MKSIKAYRCDCGEDVYEDDDYCLNCHKPTDKARLKEEEVAEVLAEIPGKSLDETFNPSKTLDGVFDRGMGKIVPSKEAWYLAYCEWRRQPEPKVADMRSFRAGWAACCKALAERVGPKWTRAFNNAMKEIDKWGDELMALDPKPLPKEKT